MKHGAVNNTSIVEEFSCDLLKELSLGRGHQFGEVKISHLVFLIVVLWNVLGWSGIVSVGFCMLKL